MRTSSKEGGPCDVLFVVPWAQALLFNNVLPLYETLKTRAPHIVVKALHAERYAGGGRSSPIFRSIGGLECYDISYFKQPHNLRSVLGVLQPRIVVTLDQSFLFGRALIKACRGLGIRTVFLQHGVISFADRKASSELRLRAQVSRLRRYALHFGPMYFRTATSEDPWFFLRPSFLKFVVGSFFRNYGFVPPKASEEARADLALVYGEAHSQKLQEVAGYRPGQVFVVGCVDSDELLEIAVDEAKGLGRERWFAERALDPARPTLTYLSQPLVEDRAVSKRWFEGFLGDLVGVTFSRRLNLVIKIHPRNSADVLGMLSGVPGVCVEKGRLASCIYYSDFVLGHTSTALSLAVAARKPILVWPYAPHGEFEKQLVAPFLEVGEMVASREELERALQELESSDWRADDALYESWLRRFYFFDPARRARDRMADILLSMDDVLPDVSVGMWASHVIGQEGRNGGDEHRKPLQT